MKTKRISFWMIYGIFVTVLVTVAILGTGILLSWLDAFEKSQPIHSAEKVFSEYFLTEKWDKVLELSGYEPGALEKEGDAAAALAELRRDKVMNFYSAGTTEGVAKYNVVLVDPSDLAAVTDTGEDVKDATAEMGVKGIPSTKIATITVTRLETEGEWGFYGYEFTSLEIFLKKNQSAEVCIPAHYTLYAEDQAIPADQIQELVSHDWNEHLPDGVKGIEFATYRFEGLLSEPTFSVKDENGGEVALVQNEKSGVWEAGLVFEADVDKAVSDRLLKGLKEYATYMQDDGSIGRVSPYFDTKSDFYKSTASNPSSFVWDHNGYEFKNESVEDFYFFDENTLCCHISFDQVLKMTGKENYVDHLSMIVFARKINGTWRIFECINAGE